MSKAAPPIRRDVSSWRRNELTLRAKLAAVTAVAVLVLALGSLTVYLVRAQRTAEQLVVHTHQVQQQLKSVLQRVTDAETGQRGFLLTGAEEFLAPYENSTRDVRKILDDLRLQVQDNPGQVRRLEVLTQVVAARRDSLGKRVEDFRRGVKPSLAVLRNGKMLMDSVRSVVSAMDSEEDSLLADRSRISNRRGTISTLVIVLGGAVCFLLLLLISNAISRDVQAREAAHRRIDDQNVELRMQSGTLEEQQIELENQLEEAQVMTEELEAANAELQRLTHVAEIDREAAHYARDMFRASDERFRFMADTIPVQVWTATPAGQLDFVSGRVADYFARTRDDVLGDGWLAVLHPDDVEAVVERWTHSLATGDPYEVTFRLRRGSDGAYRWHLGRAVALCSDDGKVLAWFGSNTDIDDQKRAEEGRERLMKALERSNVELDQFAYIASHDLKAPLRGIANLSQWIEEDAGPSFSEDGRAKMELLRGRVRRLDALIDGILAYSRVGRTRAQADEVNSTALVAEVVELLAPPLSATVEISPAMPTLVAERVPLMQVFSNLIDNALKYSDRADTVIKVAATTDGVFAHFTVTDNGPGIPPQHHDRIFAVFQRLAARDKVDGTGIGLAVVKKSVETRGGRVWVVSPVNSDTGSGTAFHFTWPAKPADDA